ncbi:hypothetical protein [Sterolibacterium denitrificans]|nr:hypothetical protein [Sterolibacterium denitrificans]
MRKFLASFVFSGLALVSLTGCEKYRLDAEVRELCAKDGGIKVYEKVTLPPEKFDQYGNIRIPTKKDAKPSDEYYYDDEDTYFRKGDPYDGPNMWRSHTKVVRRSDGKVLGESIRYTRVGGDIPGPWHPSHFSCYDMDIPMDLEKSIFTERSEK